MKLQVLSSAMLFSRAEVEVRLLDGDGAFVRGRRVGLRLKARTGNSQPVIFVAEGENNACDTVELETTGEGYMKTTLSFDPRDAELKEIVLFVELIDNTQVAVTSDPIVLMKYHLSIVDERLTDDIAKYDGQKGIHYTNNDSARVKVHYIVADVDGPIKDPHRLLQIHSETNVFVSLCQWWKN